MTTAQVIFWWETRRILFNLALLVIGIFSIAAWGLAMDRVIPNGEDAVEPVALLFGVVMYGLMANVCYTQGWIVELRMRKVDPENARQRGRRFFKLGVLGSCLLTTIPLWISCLIWLALSGQ